MAKNDSWFEKLLRAANQAAPNGIAAQALIFGFLLVLRR